MTTLFLLLVFLAELAAIAAIGYAAYVLVGGGLLGAVVGLVAIALAIAVWALFAAPKADVPGGVRLATKAVVFALAILGLVVAGRPWWALALGALIVVSTAGAMLGGWSPASSHEEHGRL